MALLSSIASFVVFWAIVGVIYNSAVHRGYLRLPPIPNYPAL
ncbi:hypothetical protein P4N68_04255 [Corynebacterium felinum]|uniref:Uncharacterized protein n=1 Tax=Corynebacterium felinum TaxID=131318 RepID=A0ABU2B8N4_9CORY|nr:MULTISPECIES: hypothetical protein [Corynebacterium]MDF5820298.1 hypothetical protein [Corynebacterium felinum]MDO4762009.1 hypothetical protein [Corynebacterium sp.]MDR7354995.1 hypothetical protein [Corynebacterium felinum]WJY94349.1 hypothetical protein CFELI_03575 [Corynebacterium felinum]